MSFLSQQKSMIFSEPEVTLSTEVHIIGVCVDVLLLFRGKKSVYTHCGDLFFL